MEIYWNMSGTTCNMNSDEVNRVAITGRNNDLIKICFSYCVSPRG